MQDNEIISLFEIRDEHAIEALSLLYYHIFVAGSREI